MRAPSGSRPGSPTSSVYGRRNEIEKRRSFPPQRAGEALRRKRRKGDFLRCNMIETKTALKLGMQKSCAQERVVGTTITETKYLSRRHVNLAKFETHTRRRGYIAQPPH